MEKTLVTCNGQRCHVDRQWSSAVVSNQCNQQTVVMSNGQWSSCIRTTLCSLVDLMQGYIKYTNLDADDSYKGRPIIDSLQLIYIHLSDAHNCKHNYF